MGPSKFLYHDGAWGPSGSLSMLRHKVRANHAEGSLLPPAPSIQVRMSDAHGPMRTVGLVAVHLQYVSLKDYINCRCMSAKHRLCKRGDGGGVGISFSIKAVDTSM